MTFFRNTGDEKIDASLGLIYRLNYLWQKVDTPAITGDFNRWDFILDRIFCNLLYKQPFNVVKDEQGKIINVELSNEDKEVYYHINSAVAKARDELRKARTLQTRHIANAKLYKALMKKDIGLRKFEHKLKLYMRDSETNPARAMWGGK